MYNKENINNLEKMVSREKIIEIFKKYNLEGFVNITNTKSSSLEYDPFMDEIAYENQDTSNVSITMIKDNRKAFASIDWIDLAKIEWAIVEATNYIELSEQDKDIMLPQITDDAWSDFTNPEFSKINKDFFNEEFNKIKNYKFKEGIKIESLWFEFNERESYYINTLWAYKRQKNNSYTTSLEIVWELNWRKDSEWIYWTYKYPYSFTSDKIEELEIKLIDKLSPEKTDLKEWKYTVTLDRDLSKHFVWFILDSLWAETIREWFWLFPKKQEWDKILSERITIVNNPNIENWLWNKVFDSEGVTCGKFDLIKNWILTSKFCDYKNSIKEWNKYLWNSSPFNILFESNLYSDDFLKDSSFLFMNLMAFHTVDSNTWNFSLNWEWYVIENWKKTKYVKNISLSWNIKDIFNNITHIWNDIKDSSRIKVGSITFTDWYITP